MTNVYVKLFFNGSNLIIIQDSLDLEILSILEEKNSSINDILEITGKSKPSIFNHLKYLKENNIVGVITNESDHRKRIFFLKQEPIFELMDGEFNLLSSDNYDIFKNNFLELPQYNSMLGLIQCLFIALDNSGLKLDNFLFYFGKMWGFKLFDEFYNENFNLFMQDVTSSFEKVIPGVFIFGFKDGNYQLDYYNEFADTSLKSEINPVCIILKGILTALLSSFYGLEVVVTETSCCNKGNDSCTFVIDMTDKEFIKEDCFL